MSGNLVKYLMLVLEKGRHFVYDKPHGVESHASAVASFGTRLTHWLFPGGKLPFKGAQHRLRTVKWEFLVPFTTFHHP